MADGVAAGIGSWTFLIIQSLIVGAWILVNLLAIVHRWDPYPFILLNLLFSTQAAYAAPIIMMSQNRHAQRDRSRDDLEAAEIEQSTGIIIRMDEVLTTVHDLTSKDIALTTEVHAINQTQDQTILLLRGKLVTIERLLLMHIAASGQSLAMEQMTDLERTSDHD